MFSPISVGAYIYQQILGSPGGPDADNDEDEEEDDDFEIESPDETAPNGQRKRPKEIVEESPIKPKAQQQDESTPDVGDLLKALTLDVDNDLNVNTPDGDVNDNLQKPSNVKNNGNGPTREDAPSGIRTPVEAAKPLQNGVNTNSNVNKYPPPGKTKDPVNRQSNLNNTDGDQDTEEMEGRMYITPEPETPFSKSKMPTVESANISGLLRSLKNKPKPKPAIAEPNKSPPRSPRKVTDDEVADALTFLLGKGGRVPRARSAVDLRSESAKRLRGGDRRRKPNSSRTFVLAMMPDGTPKRIPVERRPSLGNELDSEDDYIEDGVFDMSRIPKLPKNEFDGRQERPPTPADSFRSSIPSPSSDIDDEAVVPNNDLQSSNTPKPSHSDDGKPLRPEQNVNQSDLANLLERLKPDGKTEPSDEIKITVADLVEALPVFDISDSSDDDQIPIDQKPVIEIDIEPAAAVIPEESAVDLNILDKKQPEPPAGTRPPSNSDASSRSTDTRPPSSSDASSRSTEWQEATIDMSEDEIVPDIKINTESSPDLSSLEKFRPPGMEAPIPENDDAPSLDERETYPGEKSDVTVADLEHMLPAFESPSTPGVEDDKVPDEHTTPIQEEISNAITVSPVENKVDLSILSELDPENTEGDDSRPYDVSDIIDDLPDEGDGVAWPEPPNSSDESESDWPAPPDDLSIPGATMGHDIHDNSDDDLPPIPIPHEISEQDTVPHSPTEKTSSPKSSDLPKSPDNVSNTSTSPTIVSPDDRVPRFVAVDTPKRPKSRGSPPLEPPRIVIDVPPSDDEGTEDVFEDQNHQESSVDPQQSDTDDSSSSDEGTSVDIKPASPKEDAIVASAIPTRKPIESPDLNSLEKLRPERDDEVPAIVVEIPQESSSLDSVNGSKERARVSDLEDLIPTFDDTVTESDDDQDQFPPPPPHVEEYMFTVTVAPPPEESSIDLSPDLNFLEKLRPEGDDEVPAIVVEIPQESSSLDSVNGSKKRARVSDLEDLFPIFDDTVTESDDYHDQFPPPPRVEEDMFTVTVAPPPEESSIDLSPDLNFLEKLRPEEDDEVPAIVVEIPQESSPLDSVNGSKERARVSDLEDLIPTFDDTVTESDDDHDQFPPPPRVEEDLFTATVAPLPEESSIDLSEFGRNLQQSAEKTGSNQGQDTPFNIQSSNDLEPVPRKWSELSTESQEVTLDFTGDSEMSEDDDKVVPVSHIPAESTPDLMALERKLRPPGTVTPEALSDSDSEYQPDNRPIQRTGETVADLKDLVPKFDSFSQSSEADTLSEPASPVEEMIDEIGTVSPTRKVFYFEGLEHFAPKEESEYVPEEEPGRYENDTPLVDFAKQKSQEIIVESYMSIFREERVLELLKTFSPKDSIENGLVDGPSEDEVMPDVGIIEMTSSSASEGFPSDSKVDNEVTPTEKDDLSEVERHAPDSPAKKRRSVGLKVDDNTEDETPAKKTKTFDTSLDEENDASDEPTIIEAGISVFREETVIEASPPQAPPATEPKPGNDQMINEDDWPAPPPPDFPSPPPSESLAADEWPSPPRELDGPEHRNVESDLAEDLDTEDTSSVSSSSTEGEYVTEEPSSSGADRVFVLTVVPTFEPFNEEDEDVQSDDDEGELSDRKPSDDFVIPTENIPDQSQPPESDNFYSDKEIVDTNDHDNIPQHRGSQSSDVDDHVLKPCNTEEEKTEDLESTPEDCEPQISISKSEPVESVPLDTNELQPGLQPENIEPKDGPTSDEIIDINPIKADDSEKDFTSVSELSSTEDANAAHPEVITHGDSASDSEVSNPAIVQNAEDTPMDEAFDSSNEDDDEGRRHHRRPPHDSDSVSSYTSESEEEEAPYTPTGGRVFILTGLPGFSVRDDVSDVNDNAPEKSWPDNDNEEPSDLKHGATIPELVPVTNSPTDETPDFVQEKPIEITPVDILESMATLADEHSSGPDDNNARSPTDNVMADVQSPDEHSSPDISPHTAPDTFTSPMEDTYDHREPETSESPTNMDIPGESVLQEESRETLEDPRGTMNGHQPVTWSDSEDIPQDTGVDRHTPDEPSVAENTYNEAPREDYGIDFPESSPKAYELSSPVADHPQSSARSIGSDSSPSSTQGPSFSHYIPTSKPTQNLVPDQSMRHYETDDAMGSDTEIAQFTSNMPRETEFSGPTLPNLAPHMRTSKTVDTYDQVFDPSADVNQASPPRLNMMQSNPYMPDSPAADLIDPDISARSSDINDPASPSRFDSDMMPSNDYMPDSMSAYDPHTFDQTSSRSTDIDEPASPAAFEPEMMPPSGSPYMPSSMTTDITGPIFVDPAISRSTDIDDPASPDATHDYRVLPSKSTDIDEPATMTSAPTVQNSKSTDINDPAVPDYRSQSPPRHQRSPFEPIVMEASPMTFGKARPKTPVEYETSLVTPDVYAGDEAYEQFQQQYRGHLDDYDTVPDMPRPLQADPTRKKQKRREEKTRKNIQGVSDMPPYMAPPVPAHAHGSGVAKGKGKKVPPPIPPRIESDPLLQEPPFHGEQNNVHPVFGADVRDQQSGYRPGEVLMNFPRSDSDYDEPPMPFQSTSRSTDINDPGLPYQPSRPKSMDISDLAMSPSRSSRFTDINNPGMPYPSRARSTDFLAEPAPSSYNDGPKHARSVDMSVPSYQIRINDPTIPYPLRSADLTDPRLYVHPPRSKSTDINEPGLEPPVPHPTSATPQYLVPTRGPLPDITKKPKVMTKDVELEYLKTQLHRLGAKMSATRQELDKFKRNNPAHKYARPADRTAHSRGSSRTSIDSPDADFSDLQFSRKFFASLTDKEFGKMLEEMRRYRLAVRDKGGDLKRLSKQCDGIRLRLKQLGHRVPMDVPDARTANVRVGAIETTI